MGKPISVVVVEDDTKELKRFKDFISLRDDIVIVGMTGSSREGIELVQLYAPDAVIVDLELHQGHGTGIDLLKSLKNTTVDTKPIIIVTTNNPSPITHNLTRDYGSDYVFWKRQQGYGPKVVIDMLLMLYSTINIGADNTEFADELTFSPFTEKHETSKIDNKKNEYENVIDMINQELHLIGISDRYKGHEYFSDAIHHLVTSSTGEYESTIKMVAQGAGVTYSSIIRAMQTAINKAWDTYDRDELLKHYTALTDRWTGVPTPTEFIHYYAEKIRKTLP